MKSTKKFKLPYRINPRFVNAAEISKQTGYTPQYIRMILKGQKKGVKAWPKIIKALRNNIQL